MGPHRAARRRDAGRAIRHRRARSLADLRRVPRRVQPRRGRVRGARGGRGDQRLVAAADLARVDGARRRAGPARRGAEPDAADLPRARGRLRRAPDPGEAARRAVGVAGLRLRGDGARDRGRHARTRGARVRQAPARRRPVDPRAAGTGRGRAVPAGRRDGRPVALDLLHVGHDRGSEGRASHRQDGGGIGVHDGSRARDDGRGPQRDGVPVHPHRRDRLAVCRAHGRLRPRARRVLHPGHDDPRAGAEPGHDRGRGHRVPPRVPDRAAGRGRAAAVPVRRAPSSAAAPRSHPRCTSR